MTTAITITHLSKSFKSATASNQIIKAVDDISLNVYEGEILGILGPNGAGKTTFLNICSTLLLPDAGTIEVLGVPLVPKNFDYLRTLLNMSSGYPNYPWSLTVRENLSFYAQLYGLKGRQLHKKIDELVTIFELEKFIDRRFDELSSGTKQRLSLAKSLLNDPKIILLDEPTVGLDPDVAVKTRDVIMNILKAKRLTVLLTTHYMKEAEIMCDRIAFIKQGQLLKLATPQELKATQQADDLEEVFIKLAREKSAEKVQVSSGKKEGAVLHYVEIPRASLIQKAAGWLRRCWAFSYRNYLFAVRNVFAFAELVFWPVVSLLSIGLLGSYLQLEEHAFAFILTGAIAGGILQVTQLDVAYSLLYDVWSKSMKHTMLTPLGVSEHIFGAWLIGMVRGTAIFVILGLSSIVLFGFKFPSILTTVIFLVGVFGCALLLGLLVSFLILMFGQKAEITAWMFAYVFMLISGIYYPIDTLPAFFFNLAQWIPITYFLEYFRLGFGFTPLLPHPLLKGFTLIGIYLTLGLILMRFAFNQARRKGTIVRLSE